MAINPYWLIIKIILKKFIKSVTDFIDWSSQVQAIK